MNVDRVRLLIVGLRSGIFTQTNGTLERVVRNISSQDPNKIRRENCCLGVGCRIAQLNGYDLGVFIHEGIVVSLDGEQSYMPQGVADYYGFESTNPYLEILGDAATVANDNGYTFDDIAFALESELSKQETGEPLPIPEDRRCNRCHDLDGAHRLTLPGKSLCDTCWQFTRIYSDAETIAVTDPDKYLD